MRVTNVQELPLTGCGEMMRLDRHGRVQALVFLSLDRVHTMTAPPGERKALLTQRNKTRWEKSPTVRMSSGTPGTPVQKSLEQTKGGGVPF